ncbi:hypothetical protein BCR34DRAFT_245215 [Clohesyomyces aquaticus]|uniref:Uncharacterized protein n=1 Tax=Clohesyomyces aquaticus TaxID=1231657 RepID=A0A1Y1ZV02_9PLEO|nr:hypothetical protein BCR34DRAFT_245215 [Clohesyomyces aquaticus]
MNTPLFFHHSDLLAYIKPSSLVIMKPLQRQNPRSPTITTNNSPSPYPSLCPPMSPHVPKAHHTPALQTTHPNPQNRTPRTEPPESDLMIGAHRFYFSYAFTPTENMSTTPRGSPTKTHASPKVVLTTPNEKTVAAKVPDTLSPMPSPKRPAGPLDVGRMVRTEGRRRRINANSMFVSRESNEKIAGNPGVQDIVTSFQGAARRRTSGIPRSKLEGETRTSPRKFRSSVMGKYTDKESDGKGEDRLITNAVRLTGSGSKGRMTRAVVEAETDMSTSTPEVEIEIERSGPTLSTSVANMGAGSADELVQQHHSECDIAVDFVPALHSALPDISVEDFATLHSISGREPAGSEKDTENSRRRRAIGTLARTRRAMETEMQDIRIQLSRSIGPFTRSRGKDENAGDLNRHSAVMAKEIAGTSKGEKGKTVSTLKLPTRLKSTTTPSRPSVDTRGHTPASRSTPSPVKGSQAPKLNTTPLFKRASVFDVPIQTKFRPLNTPRAPTTPAQLPSALSSQAKGSMAQEEAKIEIETNKFATALDINRTILSWKAEERYRLSQSSSKAPSPQQPAPSTPGRSPTIFKSKPKSNHPPRTLSAPEPLQPLQNRKNRNRINTPVTPAPWSGSRGKTPAILRTPRRKVSAKLDRAIDERILEDARAGRVFTPAGQKVSELLERRKESFESGDK